MSTNKQLDKLQELKDYETKLSTMTLEELHELEQEVIKEADDVNIEVAKTTFDLPSENYKVVAEAVRYFLNKQTVQWQYTLGLATMYDFWEPNVKPKKIEFPTLDATLRTLGEMQFTGYEEWARVIAINKYFEPLHDAYADATTRVYDVAAKHNAIIDMIDKKTPIQPQKQ